MWRQECADSSTAAIAVCCSTPSRNTSRVPSHTRSTVSPRFNIVRSSVAQRIRYILIRIRIHGSKPMFLREEDNEFLSFFLSSFPKKIPLCYLLCGSPKFYSLFFRLLAKSFWCTPSSNGIERRKTVAGDTKPTPLHALLVSCDGPYDIKFWT